MVNADPAMHGKLKVVFIEDYKVSLAEIIIPAADISEQISVAGKEASGTGNMKLMINGAVTLGTLDGANVEICQQVGEENMFLFGLHAEQVEALWRSGYDPRAYLTEPLNRVLNLLTSGALGGKKFEDIVQSLTSNHFGTADGYMTVADFESYCQAQQRVGAVWKEPAEIWQHVAYEHREGGHFLVGPRGGAVRGRNLESGLRSNANFI